jgi:hypothetical protein
MVTMESLALSIIRLSPDPLRIAVVGIEIVAGGCAVEV